MALAVFGVGIYLLASFLSTPTKKTTLQMFEKYASYMENGPDDIDGETIKPAFLHLEENYSNDQQEQVIKTTQQLFNDFQTVFDKARLPLDKDARHAMSEKIEQYSENLNFIAVYNRLSANSITLLDTYAKNGRDAAINTIAQLTPSYEHNEQLKRTTEKISEYYYKYIAIYDIYDKFGCIKNGKVDTQCTSNIFDPELQQLFNYNEMIVTAITPVYNAISGNFQNATDDMKKELGSM